MLHNKIRVLVNVNIAFIGNCISCQIFIQLFNLNRGFQTLWNGGLGTSGALEGKGSEPENATGGAVVAALYSYHYYDGDEWSEI